ncbi:hypothetical protein [Tellurirhabdus bombi]|uniref:hypothetical protein n=1 Tax=Tellurirhabdus bombi TaxID=2907205 RepID=UPI001F18D938|nr:hypothetical protein [Tellurirhabdus bombi]
MADRIGFLLSRRAKKARTQRNRAFKMQLFKFARDAVRIEYTLLYAYFHVSAAFGAQKRGKSVVCFIS